MLFENYWQTVLLGAEVLHDLSWDNSVNPQFTYAQKAGPYNAAEEATGGNEHSLVMDVAFPALSADAWASVSAVLPGADLSGHDTLRMTLRGQDVTGDTLLVYVEALDRYNEDINANGLLDGESSAADKGYAITPCSGGTDQAGQRQEGRIQCPAGLRGYGQERQPRSRRGRSGDPSLTADLRTWRPLRRARRPGARCPSTSRRSSGTTRKSSRTCGPSASPSGRPRGRPRALSRERS